jgi:hypothetical protein
MAILRTRRFAVVAGLILLAVVGLYAAYVKVFTIFECEDTVLSTVRSPDGARIAVYVDRDCGATAPMTNWVKVVSSESEIANAAPIAVFKGTLDGHPRWENATTLIVYYGTAEPFRTETKAGSVQISYRKMR